MPTSTLEKQQEVSEHSLESESSQKLLFYLLEKMDKLDTKLDDRIDKLDNRIDKLDVKIDDRIDKLDSKINDNIDKLDGRIDKLDAKIDSRFLWTIGIMFTGFIGIITIMLSMH